MTRRLSRIYKGFLNDLSSENNKNISTQSYKELSYSGKSKSEASKEFHFNYIQRENSADTKKLLFSNYEHLCMFMWI